MKTFFAIAGLVFAGSNAFADEWARHWTVSAKPELRISAGDAAVIVEAGPDNSIDAKLTTKGWTIGGSGIKVEERQTGNSVQINITVPRMQFSFGSHEIRLEVRVPRELIGDLHTGDGSITLRGLHGSVRADTGDGSVHGEALDGSLDAHTGDGSVHVQGRFDKLQLHTSDGSVEVEALDGSRIDTGWRIQTGDGSVKVRVPRNLAADVEAHTGDGHIQFDLPVAVNGARDRHDVQGKLNGGGAPLVLRTGDGSITVAAR